MENNMFLQENTWSSLQTNTLKFFLSNWIWVLMLHCINIVSESKIFNIGSGEWLLTTIWYRVVKIIHVKPVLVCVLLRWYTIEEEVSTSSMVIGWLEQVQIYCYSRVIYRYLRYLLIIYLEERKSEILNDTVERDKTNNIVSLKLEPP